MIEAGRNAKNRPKPEQQGGTGFRKMGANMIIRKAISVLALTCTATMLMAHAMALPTNSSDSQERIPNGLRRMVQTLKKCDSAINDLAGQNCSFYFGEDL